MDNKISEWLEMELCDMSDESEGEESNEQSDLFGSDATDEDPDLQVDFEEGNSSDSNDELSFKNAK